MAEKDCIFCKIVAGKIPSGKVYEDDLAFAFRDISPQAPTHILIVPKEHRARLTDFGEKDAALLGHLLKVVNIIAAQEKLEQFRVVINCGEDAGQTVWHLHVHLLAGRAFGWPPG